MRTGQPAHPLARQRGWPSLRGKIVLTQPARKTGANQSQSDNGDRLESRTRHDDSTAFKAARKRSFWSCVPIVTRRYSGMP